LQLDSYSVFFTGELLPNFDLKNMISIYTKDFSWEKWLKFKRSRIKKFQIANVLSELPEGSQEYRKILFSFYLHI
jgi:hypothetical protein